jgi:hypothetical protein
VTEPSPDLRRSESLHDRLQQFIRQHADHAPASAFDELATAIARFQAETNPLIARLFASRDLVPEAVRSGDQIPAAPSDLFRLRRVASHPPALDLRCFETSGTIAGTAQRGRHPMRTTSSYELAALTSAARWLWPDSNDLDLILLATPEDESPASSLSFMLARFGDALSGHTSWHFDGSRLDVASFRSRAASLIERHRRVLVAGTSFALVHLCDALEEKPIALPAGSRLMQTGGFKGQSRRVDARELCAMMSRCLGVPRDHIISEYGMTELSSQLYTGQLRNMPDRFHPPPWLRVRAVDPITLAPVAQGEVGIARFVDLANIDSAVAIQTADRIREAGDGSIELLGRLAGARPRGCSLALEHLLDGEEPEHPL